MGQTVRHSMPIQAYALAHARMHKGAQALIEWGLGAFSCSYCSTIRVCIDFEGAAG